MARSVFIKVEMTLEDNPGNSKMYIVEQKIYLAPPLLAPGIDVFVQDLRKELYNTILKAYATKSHLVSVKVYLDGICITDDISWPLHSNPSLSNFSEIDHETLSSINSFIDMVAPKIVYEIVHIKSFLLQSSY